MRELDPDCPAVASFLSMLSEQVQSTGLSGEARAKYKITQVDAFADVHVRYCNRCRAYSSVDQPDAQPRRSAVWGGGTMGLLVGLVVGMIVRPFWTTVFYSVVIGVGLGIAAHLLAMFGSRKAN